MSPRIGILVMNTAKLGRAAAKTATAAVKAVASWTSQYKIDKSPSAMEERKRAGYASTDIPFLQDIGILTKTATPTFKKPYANTQVTQRILEWIAGGEVGPMPKELGEVLCEKVRVLKRLSADVSNGQKGYANTTIGLIAAFLDNHSYTGCDALSDVVRPPAAAAATVAAAAPPQTTTCDLSVVIRLLNEILSLIKGLPKTESLDQIKALIGQLAPNLQGQALEDLTDLKRKEIEASIDAMADEGGRAGSRGDGSDDSGGGAPKPPSAADVSNLKASLATVTTADAAKNLLDTLAAHAEEGVPGAATATENAALLQKLLSNREELVTNVQGILEKLRKLLGGEFANDITDESIRADPFGAIGAINKALESIGSLSKEKDKAVQAIRDELLGLTIGEDAPKASVTIPDGLQQTLSAILDKVSELEDTTAAAINAALAPLIERLDAHTQDLLYIRNKVDAIASNLNAVKASVVPTSGGKSVLNVLDGIQTAVDGLTGAQGRDLAAASARIAELNTQIQSLNELLRQRLGSDGAALALQGHLTEALARIATLEGQLAALQTENTGLRSQLDVANAQTADLRGQLAALQAERDALQQQLATTIAENQAALAAKDKQCAGLQTERDAEIARLRAENAELAARLRDCEAARAAAEAAAARPATAPVARSNVWRISSGALPFPGSVPGRPGGGTRPPPHDAPPPPVPQGGTPALLPPSGAPPPGTPTGGAGSTAAGTGGASRPAPRIPSGPPSMPPAAVPAASGVGGTSSAQDLDNAKKTAAMIAMTKYKLPKGANTEDAKIATGALYNIATRGERASALRNRTIMDKVDNLMEQIPPKSFGLPNDVNYTTYADALLSRLAQSPYTVTPMRTAPYSRRRRRAAKSSRKTRKVRR
jgi:hypothetical protein